MRNLKRALCLALTAVMLIGMMMVAANAVSVDDFTDGEDVVNTEAVSVLATLGVITGNPDGSYAPERVVTRAEMAKMICVILNAGKDPNLGTDVTPSYTDTTTSWAAGYIEYCTNRGIVSGYNGLFRPTAEVTGIEAAKMMLVALGYNAEFEGMVGGSWATATTVLANKKGLYEDIETFDPSKGLSRDNAAQMLYNALDAEKVSYTYALVTGENGSLTSIPRVSDRAGVTLMSDEFKAVKVEGVVTKNEFGTANGTTSGKAGETTIRVTNYAEGQTAYRNGNHTFTAASGMDVLGHAVKVYIKPGSSDAKSTVLGAIMVDSDNETVVTTKDKKTNAKMVELLSDNDLTLAADATDEEDNIVAYGTVLNVNYASTSNKTAWGTGADTFNRKGENLTIIDNNKDGVVDFIFQVSYELGKVTAYSTKDDGSISVKVKASTLTKSDKDDVVGFDDVKKGDYVLAAVLADKLYVEPVKTITGIVTAYTTSKSVTVDGTKYNLSGLDFFADSDKLHTDWDASLDDDAEAVFYFDKNGNVLCIGDVETTSETTYALIRNAWKVQDDTDGSSVVRVRAVLQDGTASTYTVHKDSEDLTDTANAADLNALATYTIKDGKIKITLVDNEQDDQKLEIKKGKVTVAVGETKLAADNKTVFFVISPSKDDEGNDLATTDVDSIKVYVGKDNVPSVSDTVFIDYEVDGTDLKAMVMVAGKADTTDYLYVYGSGNKVKDGKEYKVVLDGALKTIVADNDDALSNGLYSYAEKDGIYTLDAIADADETGNVNKIVGKSVIIAGAEYTVDNDTVFVVIDGDDTALADDMAEGDYVAVMTNSDKVIEAVYILLAYDADLLDVPLTTEAAANDKLVLGTDKITLKDGHGLTDAESVVAIFNKASMSNAEKLTIEAALESSTVADGDTVTITHTDSGKSISKTYTIVVEETQA